MYRYVCILLIFLFFSGCAEDKENNKFEKIPELTKIEAGATLGSAEDKGNLNIKELITNDRKKCYDIWMNCNNIFDFAIRVIKDKRYEEFKYFFTENVKVENGSIFNVSDTTSSEFKLPEGEYSFWQRFYNLSDNDTIFDTCYELRYKDGRNTEGCYVKFIYKEGKWYIDHIAIDIG
jgi:hypothetical protein